MSPLTVLLICLGLILFFAAVRAIDKWLDK